MKRHKTMTTNRFAVTTILSSLVCVVSLISIQISESQKNEVIAIRRSIPQLTKAVKTPYRGYPSYPGPGVTSTIP